MNCGRATAFLPNFVGFPSLRGPHSSTVQPAPPGGGEGAERGCWGGWVESGAAGKQGSDAGAGRGPSATAGQGSSAAAGRGSSAAAPRDRLAWLARRGRRRVQVRVGAATPQLARRAAGDGRGRGGWPGAQVRRLRATDPPSLRGAAGGTCGCEWVRRLRMAHPPRLRGARPEADADATAGQGPRCGGSARPTRQACAARPEAGAGASGCGDSAWPTRHACAARGRRRTRMRRLARGPGAAAPRDRPAKLAR